MVNAVATDLDIALCAEDYPTNFICGCHPGDYVVADAPIVAEHVYHHARGRHNRLWFRVSWSVGGDNFLPMSFLLDTGEPKHMYLSHQAMCALEKHRLICIDDDMDIQYVKLAGRKCPVELTPSMHAPANLIGLKLLKRLGLRLWDDHPHFTFEEGVRVFSPESFD